MSCRSRFSDVALVILMTVACAKMEDKVRLVSSDEYDSKPCWFGQHEEVEAFLVMAREDRRATPYLISARCMVTAGYTSYGEAMIHKLNTILMTDSYGNMQRTFPDITIVDNVGTHQPTPYPDSKVYYFKGRLTTVPVPYKTVYAPGKIIRIIDTKLSFERFLELSRDQRELLLEQLE